MNTLIEKQKLRSCLLGRSRKCKIMFMTTKETRICPPCKNIDLDFDSRKRKDEDRILKKFWKNLK